MFQFFSNGMDFEGICSSCLLKWWNCGAMQLFFLPFFKSGKGAFATSNYLTGLGSYYTTLLDQLLISTWWDMQMFEQFASWPSPLGFMLAHLLLLNSKEIVKFLWILMQGKIFLFICIIIVLNLVSITSILEVALEWLLLWDIWDLLFYVHIIY